MRIKLSENKKFVLRVAGIFIRNRSVLLHRAEHEDIWALPGGGCEFFENSGTALVRELKEELDASIHVKQLVFSVENFFEWCGSKTHEIGFYYIAEFAGESNHYYNQHEFIGIEQRMEGLAPFRLLFKWFPLDQLADVNIKPNFLKMNLQAMSDNPSHIIQRDH